jgi:hypothetical protein
MAAHEKHGAAHPHASTADSVSAVPAFTTSLEGLTAARVLQEQYRDALQDANRAPMRSTERQEALARFDELYAQAEVVLARVRELTRAELAAKRARFLAGDFTAYREPSAGGAS